jgi:hypothetical protein
MPDTPNPYLGLSKLELKSLLRVNKKSQHATMQIQQALEALTPYHGGRLSPEDMSLVAAVVSDAPEGPKKTDALAVLKKFFGPKPPTPPSA